MSEPLTPSLPSSPLRLATGTALVPTKTGWLLHTPTEEFLALTPEPAHAGLIGRVLYGQCSPLEAHRQAEGAGIDELICVLAQYEACEAHQPQLDPSRHKPAPSASTPHAVPRAQTEKLNPSGPVQVIGSHVALTHAAVEVLAARGIAASAEDKFPDTPCEALLAVAEWLPDRRWQELDQWCTDNGVAWHRVHREGRRWYSGPFTVPCGTATYLDLRIRRLAASPSPEDLRSLWEWLDEGGVPADHDDDATRIQSARPALDAAACDLAFHLAGGEPGPSQQTGFDPKTWAVTHHRVLPVPRNLLMAL